MDTQQQPTNEAVNKVVGGLQKDFKIVGSHRVHAWYAWAIVGIVFGMALGIIYVANRSVKAQKSDAVVRKPEYGPIERILAQKVILVEANGKQKLNLYEPHFF